MLYAYTTAEQAVKFLRGEQATWKAVCYEVHLGSWPYRTFRAALPTDVDHGSVLMQMSGVSMEYDDGGLGYHIVVDCVGSVGAIDEDDISVIASLPPDTVVRFVASNSPDQFDSEELPRYFEDNSPDYAATVAAYEEVKARYLEWRDGPED